MRLFVPEEDEGSSKEGSAMKGYDKLEVAW
jgi:hypothetical protein